MILVLVAALAVDLAPLLPFISGGGAFGAITGVIGLWYKGKQDVRNAKKEADEAHTKREHALHQSTLDIFDRLRQEIEETRERQRESDERQRESDARQRSSDENYREVLRSLRDCERSKDFLAKEIIGLQGKVIALEHSLDNSDRYIIEVHANPDGIMTSVSEGAVAILGRRPDLLVGRPVSELLPEEDQGWHETRFLEAVEDVDRQRGGDVAAIGMAQHVDGSTIQVLVFISSKQDGGYRGILVPVDSLVPHSSSVSRY